MIQGPAKEEAKKQLNLARQAMTNRAKEAREAEAAEVAKESADREEEALLIEKSLNPDPNPKS